MLLFFAQYAFLLSFMIDSNQGDLLLTRELAEDKAFLSIAACTKRCLQEKLEENFELCFEYCKERSSSRDLESIKLHKIQENFLLRLVCRTESKVTFQISWIEHSRTNFSETSSVQASPDALFIITINAIQDVLVSAKVYVSDSPFFTIPELGSNTNHSLTVLAVHGDGSYSYIALDETFKTLGRGYQPSKMGQVKLKRFKQEPKNWQRLKAEVEWQPSAERNCYFDMIYYSTDSQSLEAPTPVHFRDPHQLYSYTIPNMEFGEQFKVGVRTVNDKNLLESPVQWLIVQTPSCLAWFNYNYTLCAPLKPSNVRVAQQHFVQDKLALNVTWSLPQYLPDYYTLHILDLHKDSEQAKFEVHPRATYYYIPRITILGTNFEVHLVAHTEGGQNASIVFLAKVPREPWLQERTLIKWLLFPFVPISCIFSLCCLMLRRHKRQECSHLEVKTAPNQSSEFHLSIIHNASLLASLGPDDNFEAEEDELEVEPHNVLLQDILGEGAFGLVRRGVYKQCQVAVKLLKDHPNEEDVQAFRCEIQMLKAVGRHPNIVGIVGYSTRIGNRMMLLTEYCGLGSLQSFLRDEWKFRQEQSAESMQLKLQPAIDSQKGFVSKRNSANLLEQDTRIEYINSSILSTLQEESEGDLSRSSSNRIECFKKTLAAENKSYGLQSYENIDAVPPPQLEKDKNLAKSSTISFENQEYYDASAIEKEVAAIRLPLTYADLLDIAQQVAVGMDFLAQNKIVHRDLAARNVLISLDRTIKIADFGLSRDVYHENVYRKSGGSGKLPIKWLALESLTHQVYTSQSDVWSFGVLLYEITTLGGMPYPSIPPRDLLQLLRQGQRMKRPEDCPHEMFTLMESCWCSIPANRPTFAVLKERLNVMLKATNEQPLRLQQQQQLQIHQTLFTEQLNNPHSKVEQLPPDDSPYLQPLD